MGKNFLSPLSELRRVRLENSELGEALEKVQLFILQMRKPRGGEVIWWTPI